MAGRPPMARWWWLGRATGALGLAVGMGIACRAVVVAPPPAGLALPGPGRQAQATYRLKAVPGADRPPVTAVLRGLGGWDAPARAPLNRTTSLAVSPDGRRVAIAWHAIDAAGRPSAWAVVGDPTDPAGFGAARRFGVPPYLAAPGCAEGAFDRVHNDTQALARPDGGFLVLGLGMNANGWAQCVSRPNHWVVAEVDAGRAWSRTGLAEAAGPLGRTVSEPSGNGDADGTYHVFGQGQVGTAAFSGGFGYVRRAAGEAAWATHVLASAYRPPGMNYFLEGQGHVKPGRNAAGATDLHVAFAWNQQGWPNTFGLYYLRSADGGLTWRTADGQAVTPPLRYGDGAEVAAVVPAGLATGGTYAGKAPGTRGISVTGAPDGHPVIVQPLYADAARTKARHVVRAFDGSRWVAVDVGPVVDANVGGSGVAVNAATGQVNVVLLDPGAGTGTARVLLHAQPLAALRKGRAGWTEEVVAEIPTATYASSLKVVAVPDARFAILLENDYRNPGKVSPAYLEAPMR